VQWCHRRLPAPEKSSRGTITAVDTPKSNIQREEIEQYAAEHPYGWQDENGIDLTLIWMNLKLTPDQRVRRAQAAARQLARMLHARVP